MRRTVLILLMGALPTYSWAAGLFTQTNPYQCLWEAKRQDTVSADNQAIRRQLADCMAHAPNAHDAATVLQREGFPGVQWDGVRAIELAEMGGQYELAGRMLTAMIMGAPRPCLPGFDCPRPVPRPPPLAADIKRRLLALMQQRKMLGRISPACLAFQSEAQTPDHIDVGVMEIHGGRCPGDPDTGPRLNTFRYMRQTGQFLLFDASKDAYGPLP